MDRTTNSLTRAAHAAGYTTRLAGTTLVGTMAGWRFLAAHTARGWDVLIRRPGWPTQPTNTRELRATLKAQTPAAIR